ncbi:hypothetical protein ACIHFB_36485 [Streptomyces sp. NPDC051963]|uniref:hypothetical protein n=1 Tax=Streptomyces sp. NPDC051963 TaxID=3365678 RepID=UPI0037D7F2D1
MSNRTYRAIAATAAVLALGALPACGTETGASTRTEPASETETATAGGTTTKCVGTRPLDSLPGFPGAEGGSDDTPLYRTLAYIDLDAKPRYPAAFTGLSIDEPHRTLKVWRIPSAALDADLCGAAEKGVTIRLYDTDVTRKTLDALAERISEDMHRWDGTFQMREVGVQEEGFVSIGVDDPAKAEPILKEAYGERYLKVGHVEQAQAQVG